MESLWSYVPQDVIMEILKYIDKLEDIKKFGLDFFIDDKFYKNENSIFWKFLFRRDLSDHKIFQMGVSKNLLKIKKYKIINLEFTTIMKTYMVHKHYIETAITSINTLKNMIIFVDSYINPYDCIYLLQKLVTFCVENGYEKVFSLLNLLPLTGVFLGHVLHNAICHDNLAIVAILIKYGAKPRSRVSYNIVKNNNLLMLKFLIEEKRVIQDNPNELFIYATHRGNIAIMDFLLNFYKSNINIHYNNEYALKGAIQKGQLESVRFLVERGAHIDDALLQSKHHFGITRYLVEKGFNIHYTNEFTLKLALSCNPSLQRFLNIEGIFKKVKFTHFE